MPGPDPLLPKLANLATKAKLLSSDFANVGVRVFPDEMNRGLYFIELTKGRSSRRVRVEASVAESVRRGFTDVLLMKDLRTALQYIVQQAKEIEAKAARISRRR